MVAILADPVVVPLHPATPLRHSEHVVLVSPRAHPVPVHPDQPLHDPLFRVERISVRQAGSVVSKHCCIQRGSRAVQQKTILVLNSCRQLPTASANAATAGSIFGSAVTYAEYHHSSSSVLCRRPHCDTWSTATCPGCTAAKSRKATAENAMLPEKGFAAYLNTTIEPLS